MPPKPPLLITTTLSGSPLRATTRAMMSSMSLLTDAGTATGVGMAERLRQQIAALEVRFKSLTLRCTISMGVATPLPGETRDGYLHRADMALYSAKRSGRDRVVLASQSLSEDN